ncbi:membrane dipeptidase [Candidatus Bathyarchaeota archaeon]|nr:membrane dipeptidase [Candidatus Bathyarchaeota archaeon]
MSSERYLTRDEYLRQPFEKRLIPLEPSLDEKARELCEKLTTIDLHCLSYHQFTGHEAPYPRQRVKNSGLTCLLETVDNFGHNPNHEHSIAAEDVKHFTEFFPKQGMDVATGVADIRHAKKTKRQTVMISMEMDGSQVIGPATMYNRGTAEEHYPFLDRIDTLHSLGLRRLDPIKNFRNYIGDGCLERSDSGLSHYGLAVVERMNRVGMIIDTSHWGEQSTLDAIDVSTAPVLVSHAGARALVPRNSRLKSDALIHALAEKGGVIGVCGIPNYLSQKKRQGVEDMVTHIGYIVDLVGVGHAAIGTDVVWGDHASLPIHRHYIERMGMRVEAAYMEGMESLEEWPNIVRALVSHGYSDDEIKKIVGENALRLMAQVFGNTREGFQA